MPIHRLLLVEDDPINRAFLMHALMAPGHAIEASATGLTALAVAHGVRFDLLLLDVNLPDVQGPALLQRLRATASAASHETPAIALTADTDPVMRRRLLDDGFAAVVHKPIGSEPLRRCVQAVLDGRPVHDATANASTDWDDDAALRVSGGDAAIVGALRTLLRDELPPQLEAIDDAAQRCDTADVHGRAHRLQAAAGFCGAPRLRAAATALLIAQDSDQLSSARRDLAAAAAALLESLGPRTRATSEK